MLASEEYAFAVHGAAYSLQEIQEEKVLSMNQKVHVIMRRASVVPHDALACVALSTPQVVEPIPGDASNRVEIDGDNGNSSSSRSNGSSSSGSGSKSRASRDTSSNSSSSYSSNSRVHEAAAHHGVLLRGCWVVKSEALFGRGGGGANAAALAALHPGSTKVPLLALVASLSAGNSSSSSSGSVGASASAASSSAVAGSSSSSGGRGGGGRSGGKGAQPSSSSSSSSIVVAPKATSSALTAAEEVICDARDSMLCLLHRDGFLYRAPLTAALDGALTEFQARYVPLRSSVFVSLSVLFSCALSTFFVIFMFSNLHCHESTPLFRCTPFFINPRGQRCLLGAIRRARDSSVSLHGGGSRRAPALAVCRRNTLFSLLPCFSKNGNRDPMVFGTRAFSAHFFHLTVCIYFCFCARPKPLNYLLCGLGNYCDFVLPFFLLLRSFPFRCLLNRVADLDRPSRQWRLNRPDMAASAAESLPSHVLSGQEAQWQAMEQKIGVARILAAYDANCASLAASGKGPGPREVRPVFMIDSQPGFNPGIPGGRDF